MKDKIGQQIVEFEELNVSVVIFFTIYLAIYAVGILNLLVSMQSLRFMAAKQDTNVSSVGLSLQGCTNSSLDSC